MLSLYQGLIADHIDLDRLLKMTPDRIGVAVEHAGGLQAESVTLNKALGKLRAWTESQMSGGFQSIYYSLDL